MTHHPFLEDKLGHYIHKQVFANSGEICCPNKCPEITKVPSKKAAELKNNFYLLPKAKEQMKKSAVVMAAKAKENRSKELEMRQQSLVRLQATQNVLRDLATRSEQLLQDQNKAMVIIQSMLDKPKSEPGLICKAQYEQELRVSYFSLTFCFFF